MTCDLNCGVLYFKTDDDVSSISVGLLSISACKSRILIRGGGRESFNRVVADNGICFSLLSRDGLELVGRLDRIPFGAVDGELDNAEPEPESVERIFDDRRCLSDVD